MDIMLTKFLERIKYDENIKTCDIQLLKRLCVSFVSTIPYETLDAFGGEKRGLDFTKMYERIVVEKRGGLCIELNALLHWALVKIGFDVDMCESYVMAGLKSDVGIPDVRDHSVLIARLPNDELWLIDVGYASCFVYPLNMKKLSIGQSQPNGTYIITKHGDHYILQKKKQKQIGIDGKMINMPSCETDEKSAINKYQTSADWSLLYAFRTEPKVLDDFKLAMIYAQESHPFCTGNSIAVIHDVRHKIYLIGNVFFDKHFIDSMTVKVVEVRKCDQEVIKEVLKYKFGIVLDYELQPKSQLHWTVM